MAARTMNHGHRTSKIFLNLAHCLVLLFIRKGSERNRTSNCASVQALQVLSIFFRFKLSCMNAQKAVKGKIWRQIDFSIRFSCIWWIVCCFPNYVRYGACAFIPSNERAYDFDFQLNISFLGFNTLG